MTRILVVNPNTTAAMTVKIAHAARKAAFSGTEIVAVNPDQGPESIEGYYDEALAVPGLLAGKRPTWTPMSLPASTIQASMRRVV